MTSELYAPLKLSLQGKKWQYRGEGNANLVLALTEDRRIVRFRKDSKVSIHGVDCNDGEEAEKERIWREAVFCRGVMAPLLGSCYVQSPTAGYVERSELMRIDKLLRTQRPTHRHHKGLHLGHVMVYPDYALLPTSLSPAESVQTTSTFCVEVKPKQGWLPAADRRLSKCTYCLNQFLKLKNRTIQCRSNYCPLDLFSGNRSRMKMALQSLLVDPQNNLKIFKDGVLVYGEDNSGDLGSVLRSWFPEEPTDMQRMANKMCGLVLEALSRNLAGPSQLEPIQWNLESTSNGEEPSTLLFDRLPRSLLTEVSSLLTEVPCNWSSQPLPQNCILSRILDIQRLEISGSDCVYHKYRNLSLSSNSSDEYSYVDRILTSDTFTPIQRYLLATTAKDCSVMMSFQRLNHSKNIQIPPQHIVQDLDSISYKMNVGVSDLDPKPLSCIEKHCKRDHETLIACLEMLQCSAGEISNCKS